MPITRSRGILVIEPDPELECTLRRMNENLSIECDEVDPQMPPLVDASDPVIPDIRGEGEIRRQPPTPRHQEYYRGYENIAHSDGPVVLHPLPNGHTFVVTSSLMQMLTGRGSFSGLPSEDLYAQISKVREVFKSCVARPDLNMHVIGLRVFPLSLTGEAVIWLLSSPINQSSLEIN